MLISKQYAEAMNSIPSENWSKTLEQLEVIIRQPELRQALRNPFIKSAQIAELIYACFKKLSPAEKGLIQTLSKHKRLEQITAIHELYQKSQLHRKGKFKVMVTMAQKPTPKQKNLIESFAKTQMNECDDALFEYHIQEKIIGGFILRVNDYVIDKSIATRLESISYNTQGS